MELAVFRSGDNAWTFLTQKKDYFFCDVVYYKGLFHAVNHLGEMVCVEDGTDRVVVEPTLSPRDISTIHLVESIQGDLLMVQRFTELNENQEPADVFKCKTVDCKVFKLLRSDDLARLTWVQIESIGDQALFLGDNHAVCVSTSEFPGCTPNSIYYTEHYFDEFGYVPCGTDDDNGVFDMGNRRLELHYVPDPSHEPLLPAIWIVPNFITNFCLVDSYLPLTVSNVDGFGGRIVKLARAITATGGHGKHGGALVASSPHQVTGAGCERPQIEGFFRESIL
ncbi:hypothetical protein RJ639_009361 [Escallonia herrerae]|uniref:KIB1-4 beta-propeller domain-containing protein n=1 Tax=Escallonia herrerae TaxID=1293975 RepID=A0AA88VT83_9ASTE|nr:hypothetical protein RJ639_009361 [Escallonia herrerae]